jgi:hypothetical protein
MTHAPNFPGELKAAGHELASISAPGHMRPNVKSSMTFEAKAWPSFDGTGSLEAFLTKIEFFMTVSDMNEADRMPKLVSLIKGRAFVWLSSHKSWRSFSFDEIIALLR